MNPIKITIENGFYVMRSPKDQRLIDELKAAIHYSRRQWDGTVRGWIVHPSSLSSLLAAIERAGYERPDVPRMESNAIQTATQKTFTVEYVGQCKEREDGVISALATTNARNPWTGHDGKMRYQWAIEFPEAVLKDYFDRAPKQATGVQTLYQVLCVFETATDAEVTSAYRRLSRQWHPDVCREDNAAEMFRSITDAAKILRDPQMRRRYDAGLFLERESLKAPETHAEFGHYFMNQRAGRRKKFENLYFRSPLRCGLITAEGVQKLNRFTVSKILTWDDVADNAGRVMITSWNKHTESIQIEWI